MTSSVLLILLYAIQLTLQMELDSFLIYNENHKKCLQAENQIIGVADCMKDNKAQKFRWISKHQLINVAAAQCLAVSSRSEMSLVSLSTCKGFDELQRWECKNDTLFGMEGQGLYLYYGNQNEKVVIHAASADWSRWKIYGTPDDLCVKAYEEIYTIGGIGKPCVFPFTYNSKWYADCTTDGTRDGHLWCATTANYTKDSLAGYCPIKTSRSGWWFTDHHSGSEYQMNAGAALTWYQARKSCQQQAAELLSIPELHVETLVLVLGQSFKTTLWTGLNSLDLNSGWMWDDGSPTRYLNWLAGNPSAEHGKNCVSINQVKNSKWENRECSQKLGYICKKGNITSSYIPPPDPESINCPPTWISYAGFCYYLHKEAKNWNEAKVACRKEEGDLASLHNLEEASFVNSNFEFEDAEHVWLGLNDLKKQMFFEWSDGSEVTYTVWQRGEPSQMENRNEDCVALNTKVGKWSDKLCEKKFPYICKRKPLPFDHERVPFADQGCNMGWKRHGLYCYFVGEELSTFSEANSTCNTHSAFLVTIDDRIEQAFLTSLIGLRPEKHFWTGLSDMEERGTFKWTTSGRVLYTHWNADMPGRRQGCVVMKTGNKGGLWDVINCDEKAKSVCKILAQGVTPPPIPKTTAEPKCPTGWRTSDQISSCFKFYSKPDGEKKSWFEAQDFCRAIGGDLFSVSNYEEQEVLLSLTLTFSGSQKIWIGLVSSDPNEGFQWSDGSPLIYENWAYGEPNNHQQLELCGEGYASSYSMPWNDAHCEYPNNWICELKKGAELLPEPTSPPYPEFNLTSDGWLIRDDKQYYVSEDENEDIDRARDFCRKNYGDLASINDEEERIFLWRFVLRNRTKSSYYIGLQISLDKQFKWMDGSPVDYVAWAVNEPSFSNNEENCVVLDKFHGRWNDINCGTPFSYICERKINNINTTFAPTVPIPQGGCPSGWMAFGRKCYRIFGNVEEEDHLVEWHAARSACQQSGGNLASIHNGLEQDFLIYNLIDFKNPVWIGLNDINSNGKYLWTDQSRVIYTNWANGHPSMGYYYSEEAEENNDCVVMKTGEEKDGGTWIEQHCQLNRGYICQKSKDPALPVMTTAAPASDQYKFGGDKYKFQKTKMKWDEAQQMCKQSDYELASILDPYTASFIRVQLDTFKEPSWIGLYSNNKTDDQYKWSDGRRLRYTKWAPVEPKENSACVYVDMDGQWKTASCDENYASVCKQRSVRPATEPPQKLGKCPESSSKTWIPFRGHCYFFEVSDTTYWAQASTECLRQGAQMVSIEDHHEANFLFGHAEFLSDKSDSFWIGLYKNVEGRWLWIDKTPMDYVNWGTDPTAISTRRCITMDSKKGTWGSSYCEFSNGYICKTLKIPVSAENTTTAEKSKEEQHKPTHGVAVGVSILVIAVIATTAAVVYLIRKKKHIKAPPAVENFHNTLYFSSSNDATTQDTSVLVHEMEQS